MALVYPDFENIERLKVSPTDGELCLVKYLIDHLDNSYEVYFNPYLDGDRPDIIILKEHCAAFVIEVKDWNLEHYEVTDKNKWQVCAKHKKSQIASPHSQVFRYKKNLYDLHLPVIGLANLKNPNFFKLVHCYVYFHNADRVGITEHYRSAVQVNDDDQKTANQKYTDKEIDFRKYEDHTKFIDRKKRNIQRDMSMSVGKDGLDILLKKIKRNSQHVLFDAEVYQDFKRRLSPTEHVKKQGIRIEYDKRQLNLTKSKNGKEKIKGVAGSGKTTILAQRAINARSRHETPVLILTFNITLKNYIRDKISDILAMRDFRYLEITSYHQFFNSQVNNTEQNISELVEQYGLEGMYSVDIFHDKDTIKYNTVLLDEIQDFKPEWVKIIRDNFLTSDAEMILFGDESQNIYHRETRASVIVQGFGRWASLNRSYRTGIDSPLNQLFKKFQERYLVEKYPETELCVATPVQSGIGFDLFKFELIISNNWQERIFESIKGYMRSYDMHPNDVVVLSSKVDVIRSVNEYFIAREKTQSMFETIDELAVCAGIPLEKIMELDSKSLKALVNNNKESVEKVRRVKKNHFYGNSGFMKFSTVHSYKGLESKTVFFITDKSDSPEIVYTSITRSTENLVVYSIQDENPYTEFFRMAIA